MSNSQSATDFLFSDANWPEDVGGVSGYERFLETIADREDPEYAETIR
ncbi:plasmid pRiA4b ORF-3 family protein [Sinorhizobium sp. A49]|nr:plasmid pRiA4b ORF-3 family protein [Sinorhizobium sp. A49]